MTNLSSAPYGPWSPRGRRCDVVKIDIALKNLHGNIADAAAATLVAAVAFQGAGGRGSRATHRRAAAAAAHVRSGRGKRAADHGSVPNPVEAAGAGPRACVGRGPG
jgi:hypothetical protein